MRVVICTDTYLPQVNGVSVVTERSATGLAARGWEVTIVAPRYPALLGGPPDPATAFSAPAAPRPRMFDVPSVSAPRYPEVRLALPYVPAVMRAFGATPPDLVHCATEGVIGRMGMWLANRRGLPVVTSYHTNFAQYAHAYGLGRMAGFVERSIARFHRRARRAYTPSESSRQELYRLGVEDVEVWGRGVDLSLFSPARRSAALRASLGITSAFTLLYVGRLAPEKSVGVVLRAYRQLLQKLGRDAVRLVVAGSGPDEAALREAAPHGTVFLGNLDRQRDLPALYASADAFVFASTTETLGLVVLEAMASGLPVLATPANGVAEYLRDGVNGLAFAAGDHAALADAMARISTEPDLQERLGGGALTTAQTLGWDAELDRLDASYRRIHAEWNALRHGSVRIALHGTP